MKTVTCPFRFSTNNPNNDFELAQLEAFPLVIRKLHSSSRFCQQWESLLQQNQSRGSAKFCSSEVSLWTKRSPMQIFNLWASHFDASSQTFGLKAKTSQRTCVEHQIADCAQLAFQTCPRSNTKTERCAVKLRTLTRKTGTTHTTKMWQRFSLLTWWPPSLLLCRFRGNYLRLISRNTAQTAVRYSKTWM